MLCCGVVGIAADRSRGQAPSLSQTPPAGLTEEWLKCSMSAVVGEMQWCVCASLASLPRPTQRFCTEKSATERQNDS